MSTATKPRTKKSPSVSPAPAPAPAPGDELTRWINYTESLISGRLAFADAQARWAAIARGILPTIDSLLSAYAAAYPAELPAEEDMVVLLEAYVDAKQEDSSLGLHDFLESFFNELGEHPRVDPLLPSPPAQSTEKPAKQPKATPENRVPLEGQQPLPLSSEPVPEAQEATTDPEPIPEPEPTHEPAELEPAELEKLRTQGGLEAQAAQSQHVAGKSGKGRAWPVGSPMKYKADKSWILGTVLEDHGDGRLTFSRQEHPDEQPWTVARARCQKLKANKVSTEPVVEEPEAAGIVLSITEAEAAQCAGWLAMEFVEDKATEADLVSFEKILEDGRYVVLIVVNGTPGQKRPHVLLWVLSPAVGDKVPVIEYEHPPSDYLLGRFTIAVAGKPAILDVCCGTPAE